MFHLDGPGAAFQGYCQDVIADDPDTCELRRGCKGAIACRGKEDVGVRYVISF